MRDKELLSVIDVEDFLTELGIRNVKNTYSGEIQYSCPFPGHSSMDSNPSASMSTEARPTPDGDGEYPPTSFYCFGCGAKGTAISFLAEYEGVSPITAKRWLRERFAPNYQVSEDGLVAAIEEIFAEKKKAPMTRAMPILDEEEIEKRRVDWVAAEESLNKQTQIDIPVPILYMFGRGFNAWALELFQVGYDSISQRLSIPARNEDGLLVGFKGRAWWDAHPKYLALGGEEYGFEPYEVSRILYGLHLAKESTGPLIVVEGELNAIAMVQKGFPRTVGISGRRLSRIQIDLIKKYADEAIMFFDEEEDGYEAARKLMWDISTLVVPAHDKDAADSTAAELRALVLSAQPAILMPEAQVGIVNQQKGDSHG